MGKRGKRGGQLGRPRNRADMARPEAPAAWGRITQIAEDIQRLRLAEDSIIKDARLSTMLYRMKLFGGVGEIEYETGCMVAEIYGLHDRLVTGAKRNAASPSYDKGWSKGDALATERMTADDVKTQEKRARRARNRWLRLQACMSDRERTIVEDVCVLDRAAPASLTDQLADALTTIATEFHVWEQVRAHVNAPAQKQRSRRSSEQTHRHVAPQNVSREKEAFFTTMHHARPDMDRAALEKAWTIHTAVRDRARFRQEKERSRAGT